MQRLQGPLAAHLPDLWLYDYHEVLDDIGESRWQFWWTLPPTSAPKNEFTSFTLDRVDD